MCVCVCVCVNDCIQMGVIYFMHTHDYIYVGGWPHELVVVIKKLPNLCACVRACACMKNLRKYAVIIFR